MNFTDSGKRLRSVAVEPQGRAMPSRAQYIARRNGQKMEEYIKNFLDNSLQNSRGTDANKIFVAKAAYGMVETAPVPIVNQE
ncbi:hypothetical protein ASU35_17805 [Acetivibrio ethanolgignens]|uniref:Uncharacterized protein n=1 Tax=Acetivibrio ethanolgignens TaxID=290052 RepID=A0A0V8QH33_9FIRM|nr:hypothetical protein ASU35_17805 [Acetivibrio ethanolgignens]